MEILSKVASATPERVKKKMNTLAYIDSISDEIKEIHYLNICNALKQDQNEDKYEIAVNMLTHNKLQLIHTQEELTKAKAQLSKEQTKSKIYGKIDGFVDCLVKLSIDIPTQKQMYKEYIETLNLPKKEKNKLLKNRY